MKEYFKNLNLTYIFIVATVSFLWFIFKEKTAYAWPAIDMMPFFERYKDPSFLINDFFTNAISNEPNPRWVFGYFIIFFSEIFNVDWYLVSYTLKVILVLATPILFYMALFSILKKYLTEKQLQYTQILILLAILIVIYPRISGIFSIAWWRPFFVQSMSQNLSLAFGLMAIIFSQYNTKKSLLIGIVLFACATFVHPAIGLFVLAFYLLSNIPFILQEYRKYIVVFIGGFLVPAVIVMLLFKASSPLDTMDFVNIYAVENHSSHYHLKDFGTLTPLSWLYSFGLMITLLLIPIFYFYKTKEKRHLIVSSIFLGSYLLSVLAQYVFIDIFPSKTVASIGPVRFSLFAYWMIVISWVLMLSRLQFIQKLNFDFKYKKIFLAIGVAYFIVAMIMIDNPKKDTYEKNIDVFKFLETTPKDSVFAVYFGQYKLDVPNIAHRAVFVGNGFPFNESYFLEYQDRTKLIYGSRKERDAIEGTWEGDKVAKFFRTLKPLDFAQISKKYQLDYIVIESQFSSNFKDYNPVFENEQIKIYKVEDFKETK